MFSRWITAAAAAAAIAGTAQIADAQDNASYRQRVQGAGVLRCGAEAVNIFLGDKAPTGHLDQLTRDAEDQALAAQ